MKKLFIISVFVLFFISDCFAQEQGYLEIESAKKKDGFTDKTGEVIEGVLVNDKTVKLGERLISVKK